MSYAAAVFADSPIAWWKLGEADGAGTADNAEGTAARDGTYGGGPNLGETDLLTGAPGETSMLLDGTAKYMDGPALSLFYDMETWAVELAVHPTDTAQRGIIQHPNKWQLYRKANGKLDYYAWIGGWFLLSGNVVVPEDVTSLIGIERTATHMRIYVNGELDVELAQAGAVGSHGTPIRVGTTAVATAYFVGYISHVSIYANGLTAERWEAHYNAATSPPNDPPSTPGPFTVPAAAAEYNNSIAIAYTPGVDPDGDPVTHDLEYSPTGVAPWTAIASGISGGAYVWNTTAVAFTEAAKVRVRAYDASGGGYSAWAVSDTFTIRHPSAAAALTLEVLRRADLSVFVKAVYSDPDGTPHNATQWRLYSAGPTLEWDSGWDTIFKAGRWLTGLPENTTIEVQARARDAGGQVGVWVSVTFKTRRVQTLGAAAGFNQDRNHGIGGIVATYGELVAGAGFVPAYPDLQPYIPGQTHEERGVRFRWTNGLENYEQPTEPASEGPNVVQYDIVVTIPGEDAGYISFLLVFKPEYFDPSAMSLLFGSEDWWIYRSGASVIAHGGHFGAGVPLDNFLGVAGLLNYEQNILIITYKYEHIVNNGLLTPGEFVMWLNDNRAGIGNLYAHDPTNFPQTDAGGGTTVSRDMRFTPGGAPHDYIYLGSQSSDGAVDPSDSNYYSFAGMFLDFAMWDGRRITDSDAAALIAAFESGGENTLRDLIISMDPILYDRFDQPRAPEKPTLEGAPS